MLKLAVVPGQLVKEVKALALTLVKTVRLAQLVMLVQKPETATQYWPALAELTLLIEIELLVSPVRRPPSLNH